MSKSKMSGRKNKNNCSKNCLWCNIINIYNYDDNWLLVDDVPLWKTTSNGYNQMKNISYFKCLVCNYDSKMFKYWKAHVLSVFHVSMCHKITNLFSYACGACKIMFYGPEEQIKQHRLKNHLDHGNLPFIYILMEELLRNFNTKSNDLFFCTHCKKYTNEPCHDFDVIQPNKVLYYCTYCCVTLLCSAEVLDCHFLSVEHVTLECISLITEDNKLNNLEKSTPNVLNKMPLLNLKLPYYILKRFQNTPQSMAKCKTCNNLVAWKSKIIVKHVYLCKNNDQIASNTNKTSIKTFDCRVCNYVTGSFSSHVRHVISSWHVSKSRFFGQYFSYFCTICDLYLYSSISSIKKHWMLHNKGSQFTGIPSLSQFLTNNFNKKVSKIVGKKAKRSSSKFIDFFDDKKSNNEMLGSFLIQCHACKINFFTSVNDYNLHEISSEHIILKYFISNYLSTTITEANNYISYESSQLRSNLNDNFIKNNKASTKALKRLSKLNRGSNLQEFQEYKEYSNKKDEVISNNSTTMSVESHKNNNNRTDSQNLLSTSGHGVHKNWDDDMYYKTLESSSVIEVIRPEFDHSVIGFDDVSISSDDEDSIINVPSDELENVVIQKDSYVDTSKTLVNNTSICLLNTQLNSKKVCLEKASDEAYGQYVTQRLKNLHNESLKSEIKLEIDYLINSKIVLTTKDTVEM